jgi:hypothetical protein
MAAPVAAARAACAVLVLCAWVPIASAQEVPPPAYQLAAQRAGIPSPVLFAVALQESGARLHGRLIPWPWTLNVAGRAERYATRAEACAGLRRALARTPASRIDAGLGQVNLGYHAHRYEHPCDLLDPYRNLAIAADILLEQHTPGEDWMVAIGRYHRPAGGEPAARYRRSVHRHLPACWGRTPPFLPTLSPGPAHHEAHPASHDPGTVVGHRRHRAISPPAHPGDRVPSADRRRGPWWRLGLAVLPGFESTGRGPGPAARMRAGAPHRQSGRCGSGHAAGSLGAAFARRRTAPRDPRTGLTPLFLVGDDDRSRAWLRQRRAALQELRAVGLVVNVTTPEALVALRRSRRA